MSIGQLNGESASWLISASKSVDIYDTANITTEVAPASCGGDEVRLINAFSDLRFRFQVQFREKVRENRTVTTVCHYYNYNNTKYMCACKLR